MGIIRNRRPFLWGIHLGPFMCGIIRTSRPIDGHVFASREPTGMGWTAILLLAHGCHALALEFAHHTARPAA